MFSRLAHFLARHPQVTDGMIALVLGVFIVPDTVARFEEGADSRWGLLLSALFLVPLVWRRTRPEAAAYGVVAAHLFQLMLKMTNHMVCLTKYWISINAAPETNNTIDCFFLA